MSAAAMTAEAALDVEHLTRPSRVAGWLATHPRAVDVVLAVGLTAACVTAALLTRMPDWPVTVAAAVAAGGALLWRRSQPVWVLAAVGVFAGIGYSPQFALIAAVAVFTLADRAPTVVAISGYLAPVLATMLATTVKTALGLPAPAPSTVAALGLGVTIVEPIALIGLSAGMIVRSRRQRRHALLELFTQRVEHARAIERSRITAEMHDVVGHSLTVMIALANGVAMGWKQHPERSELALRELSRVGADALSEMQRTLRLLRDSDAQLDDALHSSGYDVPPLGQLIEVFRTAGLPVMRRTSGPPISDDPILRLAVYRIVQEALTNALRYAVEPTLVEVVIANDEQFLRVAVTDNGRAGRRESVGAGRGIPGISSRVDSLGGTSTVGPGTAAGWSVTATIPVRRTSDEGRPAHD